MFDACGHDNKLALGDALGPVPEFHDEDAFDHEEHLVFFLMGMPFKRALQPGKLDVHTVHLAHDFGLPGFGEEREFLREVDGVGHFKLLYVVIPVLHRDPAWEQASSF